MADATETLESTRQLLLEGIRGHLQQPPLSAGALHDFDIALTQQGARLCLTFPSNFATLKMNDGDERAFMTLFNAWAAKLATKSNGTFVVSAAEPGSGLRQIQCTASSPFDMIQGVNQALCTTHQVDASFLGRGRR